MIEKLIKDIDINTAIYHIIDAGKCLVFETEKQKQDYFDELIKNQPIEDDIVE